MPQKEEQFLKFTRRGRSKRRSAERRDRNSLVESSTPVDTRKNQKTTNPKDNIQKRRLPPVPENIATATGASKSKQLQDDSSESSFKSNISDIKGKKNILQE